MEIARIKEQLSIGAVLAHYGLYPNKNGMLNCPFHDDKTPSMQIYGKTNTFCCFSSNCSAGTGDVIDFIELKEACSKHQAILKAKEILGVSTANSGYMHRESVLQRFWGSCKEGIKRSSYGQNYLIERGLTATKVGYCSVRAMKNWSAELLKYCEQYGLFSKEHTPSTWRPHFRDCVVFPLLNASGKVAGLYGRHTRQRKHVYLQGSHQGLYPAYPSAESDKIVLTESVIDAATLLAAGIHTPLALYGTNGFTEEHGQVLQSLPKLQEVVLFMDGDQAGKAAVARLSAKLHEQLPQLQISYVETPENEDINSLWVSHAEEAPALMQHLLESRKVLHGASAKAAPKQETALVEAKVTTTPETQKPTPVLNSSDAKHLQYQSEVALLAVRGGVPLELASLKVSLHITHPTTGRKYRSKVDLYEARQVQKLSQEAGEALHLSPSGLQAALETFTDLLEQYREAASKATASTQVKVNPSDRHACLEFLKAPFLPEGLNAKIGEAGVTGEESNRLFLLGIAASYKMPVPLHALIQGSSGSGKTHLLASISRFIPAEDCLTLTRVTDSSFYNYGEHELSHKLVCFEDLDGLKEDALLAVRELISRGQLTSSTSGKDEQGNIQSYVRSVYGPIASLSCTTQGSVYEDNMGRCFLVAVDESPAQTERILHYQNQKAAGLIASPKEQAATAFLQNCLRLLKPYEVVNPYALSVRLPEQAHKIRRLNGLYQSYVQQITLLHQYQRQQDGQGRLVSTIEDLKVACRLMFESIILKVDELDGSLRQFYERLKAYVKAQGGEEYAFGQREVRKALSISKSHLHRHLQQLLSLEYLTWKGGYANKGYRYQIIYWDDNAALRKQIHQFLTEQLSALDKKSQTRNTNGTLQGRQNKVKVL